MISNGIAQVFRELFPAINSVQSLTEANVQMKNSKISNLSAFKMPFSFVFICCDKQVYCNRVLDFFSPCNQLCPLNDLQFQDLPFEHVALHCSKLFSVGNCNKHVLSMLAFLISVLEICF